MSQLTRTSSYGLPTRPRKRRRVMSSSTRSKRSAPVAAPGRLTMDHQILRTKQKAVLRYAERFQLNPGTGGTSQVQVFSANGLFDPDITGSGHQPRGFDQLMLLYDHYVVEAAIIKVYADNNSEASAQVVGVALRDTPTTIPLSIDNQEYGIKKDMLLAETNSGGNAKTMTWKVNPGKFLGRGDVFSDPEFKGSSGSNPVEQAFFHVYAFPINTGDAAAVNLMVEIEYHASLIEPKQPSSS